VPTRDRSLVWLGSALAILLVGTALRLTVRSVDVTAVSAAVLAALLWLGVWLVALLLSNPRAAAMVGLATMLVLNVAALPARQVVEYDQQEALFRTDRPLTLRVAADAGQQLVVMVEPVFDGAAPPFALAADVAGSRVQWSCPLRRGMQRLVLPLPARADEVNLRLTGTPDRERNYLLVHWSSAGLPATADATRCSLA
jgi:hypothetical protein